MNHPTRIANRRLRAFTIVELLTCIAIIAVVAAILTPVLRSVKRSGEITSSLSNLHQMHLALMMYQSANGGGGSYGSLAAMGLPTAEELVTNSFTLPLGLTWDVWRSPCGQNPAWADMPVKIQYEYFLATSLDNPTKKFGEVSQQYQENLIAFIDMNCAEHGVSLVSEYFPHRGLGVRLSGSLADLTRAGDYRFQKWWQAPTSGVAQ